MVLKKKGKCAALIDSLMQPEPVLSEIEQVAKKKEKKNPPLLFNLAELQNTASKLFKISPDETLSVVQELYEKKVGNVSAYRCPCSFQCGGKKKSGKT